MPDIGSARVRLRDEPVLLGEDPAVTLSKRATEKLREGRRTSTEISPRGTILLRGGTDVWWWTWSGARANATFIAGLPGIVDEAQRPDNRRVR